MGKKLIKTVEALTPPLTPDLVDGVNEISKEILEEKEANGTYMGEDLEMATTTIPSSQFVRVHIGEGKDIDFEIPIGLAGNIQNVAPLPVEPMKSKTMNLKKKRR